MNTLIIGGSGFLGSRLVSALNEKCHSTYYKNKIFPTQIYLDLGDQASIKECLCSTKPDLIIHCGGLTDTDFCEVNKDLAVKINVLGTEALVNFFDGKLIYFSTDYVFDGESAPYNEFSLPNPINHYGRTKLLAEEKVLSRTQNLVVRVSGLYGFNKNNNKFIDRLRKKRIIYASKDFISTPTYIEDIVRFIPELINMCGILHLTGEQSFSRYEFTNLIVNGLGLESKVVVEEENKIARRPRNSSLVSIHSIRKTSFEEALEEIRRQYEKNKETP